MNESTRRGRPAEFRNAAEKQKAYRERQKAQKAASDLALALLEDANQREVTLRNTVLYWRDKNQEVEVKHRKHGNCEFAYLFVGGQFKHEIGSLLFNHLVRKGVLVFIAERWDGNRYEFSWV